MQEPIFLKQQFSKYYSKNSVESVPEVEKREFGIGEFGKKISSRHLSFKSYLDFNSFLVREAPLFVSFSCAYYSFPSAKPMEAKNLIKSDLVFEFDADDFKTDCKQLHDSWVCSCGASGKGSLSNCTTCGKSVLVDQWVCNDCLGEVKKQVFRLVDILESELGITSGLYFNFSGFKGYHVHIRNDDFSSLPASSRVDLTDYLSGESVKPDLLGFYYSKGDFFVPSKKNLFGLRKRLVGKLKFFLNEFDAQKLSACTGISMVLAKKIVVQKQEFVSALDSGVAQRLSPKHNQVFWSSLLELALNEEKIGLDRQTSIDLKKIVRVPQTLHGSTGLLAKTFSFSDLNKFSPLDDSVVFSGSQSIRLKSVNAPRFYLGGKWWGPFSLQDAELPEFVAVFLLCRGSAVLY